MYFVITGEILRYLIRCLTATKQVIVVLFTCTHCHSSFILMMYRELLLDGSHRRHSMMALTWNSWHNAKVMFSCK